MEKDDRYIILKRVESTYSFFNGVLAMPEEKWTINPEEAKLYDNPCNCDDDMKRIVEQCKEADSGELASIQRGKLLKAMEEGKDLRKYSEIPFDIRGLIKEYFIIRRERERSTRDFNAEHREFVGVFSGSRFSSFERALEVLQTIPYFGEFNSISIVRCGESRDGR